MTVTSFPNGISVGSPGYQAGSAIVNAGSANFPSGMVAGNIKYGQTVITGIGTAPTGLSGTPTYVVASLRNIGSAAGDPFAVQSVPIGGGSVVFTVRALAGGTATNAGTVNYIAIGTP